jgi:tyrosine-protein kinase Etk/Wzc
MENTTVENKSQDSGFNFIEILHRVINNWYYFLITVVISFFVAKYYLKHTIPIFDSKIKVKIIDDSKNNFAMPTNGISLFGKTKVNLDNHIEILKSHRIIEQVIKSLDLNTIYYSKGYINQIELWKNRPISIVYLDQDVSFDDKRFSLEIELEKDGYRIVNVEDKSELCQFNSPQKVRGVSFKIQLQVGKSTDNLVGKNYIIYHEPIQNTIIKLSRNLKISNVNENSDILTISLNGENKDKSEAILNEVVRQFDIDGLTDRRLISQRTIDFVNKRFMSLEKQLDSIESNKASYKSSQGITFIESDAGIASGQKVESDNDVFKTETQIALSKVLEQSIKSDRNLGLIPTNIGVSNSSINLLISDFNTIVLERDKNAISGGTKNPRILALNDKLKAMQQNILFSIRAYQEELSVSLSKNSYNKRQADSKYSAIPYNEKVLHKIERQKGIKESLYLLLLQKREEAAVNLAITASSIKIVDFALTEANPISPNRSTIYTAAILIGLLIPLLIIYIRIVLDDKVHTREDVLRFVKNKIIISEVPHIDTEQKLTGLNDRSLLGESFRILRTNLTYVLPFKVNNLGQTILVTSTIKGEGKTFTSLNLAISFSIMNKKVLLIGADMRNPQLHNYLTTKKTDIGLQDYLHDLTIDWMSVIKKNQLDNANLDIVLSGKIPPNPAELLSNGRFDQFINEAKKEYDYIIIDSAPTLLVTDTLLISQLVDTTLYVVRSGFTPKKILDFSVNLSDRNKLKNLVYVINNVGLNYGYGYKYGYSYRYKYSYAYGYGYGYGGESHKKKSYFDKIVSKIKSLKKG